MAISDNLWAYWKFDEESGSRMDSSGNGRHLPETWPNVGSNVDFGSGKWGNAADIWADPDLFYAGFELSEGPGVNLFSFSFWLMFSGATASGEAIIDFTNGSAISWARCLVALDSGQTNSKIMLEIRNPLPDYVWFGSPVVTPDVWHNLIFINDSGTFKVYLDGSLQHSYSYGSMVEEAPLRIAILGESTTGSSLLDELGAWQRALTPTEIAWLQTNQIGVVAARRDFLPVFASLL